LIAINVLVAPMAFSDTDKMERAMNAVIRSMAGLSVFAALAGPAVAQDVGTGEHIARTWCAGCHQVGKDDASPRNDAVPSFVSVAGMSSTTAAGLQAFLSTPHSKMPDYSLSRAEIKDVSAYILSLRR
jgi:mono/diheme cytochrome c family protein